MAVNFPASLQQKFNVAGFSFQIGSTTVRSTMDVGPDKIRRRYTKSIDSYRGSIVLNYSEWQTLYDFYNTTLDGGSLPFNFEEPFQQTQDEFRFVDPPSMTPIGDAGLEYRVTMNLEKLP